MDEVNRSDLTKGFVLKNRQFQELEFLNKR